MKLAAATLALALSGCSTLPDDWTEADRRRAMAVYASLAADAITTSRIQDRFSRPVSFIS